MYRTLLIGSLLLCTQFGHGQQQVSLENSTQGEGFLGRDGSVKGTKYFFDHWGMGRIMFTDGKATNNGLLQVDLELDRLLVCNGADKSKGVIVEIDNVEKFTINEFKDNVIDPVTVTFVKKSPQDFENPGDGPRYYRQLTRNSDHVLEEITKSLFDHSQDNTAGFDKKSYKEYRTKTAYHIKDAQGIYRKTGSLNERAFAKAYPDLKKKLKSFVKANGIDFENADHLDRVMAICLGSLKE